MRLTRLLGVVFLVLVAVSLIATAVTLPPRAAVISGSSLGSGGVVRVRGTLHVHTRRSDGSGSLDDVARAASRAGLDFVVLSDHGDGTRALEPPRYRDGVLCIDAVEISTDGGHVLALGLPVTPYRLAGHARDVIEDIHRFGGTAIVTHPDSPKPELRWEDWSSPIDGFEWVNVDSEWRDESPGELVLAFAHYFWRGPEAIARIFTRPETTLARWDRLMAEGRRLFVVAGADAHARLGGQEDGTDTDGPGLPLPSYEAVFRTLSTSVELDRPLDGDAAADAARIIDAIDNGRAYSTVDGYATGGAVDFFGESPAGRVRMGEAVAPGSLSRLSARVAAPVNAILRLLQNGVVIAETSGVALDADSRTWRAGADGVRAFRVEVVLGAANGASGGMPWLVSNAITERPPAQQRDPASTLTGVLEEARLSLGMTGSEGRWTVEHDGASDGTLSRNPGEQDETASLQLDYRLGDQPSSWVAVALRLPDAVRPLLPRARAWRVVMSASSPMRLSVQMRATSATQDLRWVRSMWIDRETRTVLLDTRSFRPVGPDAAAIAPATAQDLLIVINRDNTAAGARGQVRLDELALVAGE